MSRSPQSVLFKKEYVPHFVNEASRGLVLNVYRNLHRDLNKLPDQFIRTHLKQYAQDSFARFKYVTDSNKVKALLDHAEANEFKWLSGSINLNHKDYAKMLDYFCSTFKVQHSPLRRIIYTLEENLATKSLVFVLNNATVPNVTLIEDHNKIMNKIAGVKSVAEISDPFWKLMAVLIKNKKLKGKHERKLMRYPEEMGRRTLTLFGEPLAEARQANMLRALYNRFLRDMPRPVVPEVLDHMVKQSNNMGIRRKLRRRYEQICDNIFTVDESGKVIQAETDVNGFKCYNGT